MRAWLVRSRGHTGSAVLTASCMYGGAAFAGVVESLIPGTPRTPIGTALFAVGMTGALALFGRRLPARLLPGVGFMGIGLIAYSLAHTQGYGDGAALYAWPVLWTAYFFDRRMTVAAMVILGIAHAVALTSMPAGVGYGSRWIDVMVSMSIVAAVVRLLGETEERLRARLSEEARTDQLTGLLNRRGVTELIATEVARASREDTSVGVIVVDIDHFKHINDAFGHDIGDRVIAHVGETLARHTRSIDLAARIGGEEFMVVLPRCEAEEARATAERLRCQIAAELPTDLPAITASAGVAAHTGPSDFQPVFRAADRALFRAKADGRDRSVLAPAAQPPPTRLGAGLQ